MVVSVCSAGDRGLIPGLGRSPGEGNGSPLQYSCLENYMGGGACVHGVAKSRTDLATSLSLSLSLIPALVLRHLWISFQAANILGSFLNLYWSPCEMKTFQNIRSHCGRLRAGLVSIIGTVTRDGKKCEWRSTGQPSLKPWAARSTPHREATAGHLFQAGKLSRAWRQLLWPCLFSLTATDNL